MTTRRRRDGKPDGRRTNGGTPPIKREQISVAAMVDALTAHHGVVSRAARALGCSPRTIHAYMAKHEEVRNARTEAREELKDICEVSIFKAMAAGEAWACCFFAKTQMRDRGYIERQEVSTSGLSLSITPEQLAAMSDEELNALYAKLTASR